MTSWLDDLFGSAGAPTDAAYITVGAPPVALTGARALGVSAGQVAGSDGGAGSSYTLGLAASGATPGAYTAANITVDTYGRVTSVASGTHNAIASLQGGASGEYYHLTEDEYWYMQQVITDAGQAYTWGELTAATDYTATPASATQLTMLLDWTAVIQPGDPIRWHSNTPAVASAVNNYSVISTLTGVSFDTVDEHGRLYLSQEDEGGGDYSTQIYNDEAKTSLVAHTANYSSTGSKAITADNGSGLGGTITVSTYDEVATTVITYWRYGIVASISSVALNVHGHELNDGASAVVNRLFYGNPERVIVQRYTLPGAYASGDETDALRDIALAPEVWLKRRAHVVRFGISAHAVGVGGTRPGVQITLGTSALPCSAANSGDGPRITTADTWVYAADVTPGRGAVDYGDAIELDIDAPAADAADTDLVVLVQLVQE